MMVFLLPSRPSADLASFLAALFEAFAVFCPVLPRFGAAVVVFFVDRDVAFLALFVFGVACSVIPVASFIVPSTLLMMFSPLAVDPRLTIHHSGAPGKRGQRSEKIAVA